MRCCFNLHEHIRDLCFDPETIEKLSKIVELKPEAPAELDKEWLKKQIADCEVVITGWNSVPLDEEVLAAAPKLKLALHSAGSIRAMVTPAFWEHGLRVTSAANVNGIPVAEFLLGQILMCFKDVFNTQHQIRVQRGKMWKSQPPMVAYYKSTVGVIGMGNVGKHLLKLLGAFDFRKLIHSFYPFEKEAAAAGATLVEIDDIMREADAVVLLAPNIPEYRHMIDARRLALMKDGAYFLNSARGALVDEEALIAELRTGRISACLDVTDPEPPADDSPFYDLPNCVLTPHIAGSTRSECRRLGNQVLNELRRYLDGQPFDNEITEDLSKVIG